MDQVADDGATECETAKDRAFGRLAQNWLAADSYNWHLVRMSPPRRVVGHHLHCDPLDASVVQSRHKRCERIRQTLFVANR
jgi:hypothetical protein